jgi:hypothetical protein
MFQIIRAVLTLSLLALLIPAAATAAPDRFQLGVEDPTSTAEGGGITEDDPAGAYSAAASAGFGVVRVSVPWAVVAPNPPDASADPDDPAYNWGVVDARVQAIRNRGMQALLSVHGPPTWAQPRDGEGHHFLGAGVSDYSAFMAALARRYDGSGNSPGRAKYFEAWNEPNLINYFQDSPDQYRDLLNGAYDRIHAVHKDNLLVAGALAPIVTHGNGRLGLQFIRELFCLSKAARPKATCHKKVKLDAFSVHPYTSGGPRHKANEDGNISLGNLPQVTHLLRAAERVRNVSPRRHIPLWITEFSWDTKGPDPYGVPLARHARWVAEALYRAWKNDVSLLIWFQLRDNPEGSAWGDTWQSGLYFLSDKKYSDERRKPFAKVLKFPFAAVPEGGGVTLWGRKPDSRGGTVSVQRRAGGRWRLLTRVHANSHGIFHKRIRGGKGALLRAHAGKSSSPPFKATSTPDIRVNPFGGPLH